MEHEDDYGSIWDAEYRDEQAIKAEALEEAATECERLAQHERDTAPSPIGGRGRLRAYQLEEANRFTKSAQWLRHRAAQIRNSL